MKRNFILAGIIVAVLAVYLFGYFTSKEGDLATGTEYTPPDGPALFMRSEELYRALNDDVQFTQVRDDVAYYGRKAIPAYKEGDNAEVIFEVTSDLDISGDKITVEGKYQKDRAKIKLELTKLKNSRLSVSLSGKDKINLDAELPSNTKRNKYIANLPIDKDEYSITYDVATDVIQVIIYDTNQADFSTDQIMNEIGTATIEEAGIELIVSGSFIDRGLPVEPLESSEGLD